MKIIIFFITILICCSCSLKERKTCCPKKGHGMCPICFDYLILKDIKNGKLVR